MCLMLLTNLRHMQTTTRYRLNFITGVLKYLAVHLPEFIKILNTVITKNIQMADMAGCMRGIIFVAHGLFWGTILKSTLLTQ